MTTKRKEELQVAFGELYTLHRATEGWIKDTVLDVMLTIRAVLRDEEVTE